jgi:hypothetical protein
MSTVRVWPDEFRDGQLPYHQFSEKESDGRADGLQPLIAVLRLFFSSGIPVRPVRQFLGDDRFCNHIAAH